MANRDALYGAGYLLFDGLGAPNNIELAAYFDNRFLPGPRGWRTRRGISSLAHQAEYFERWNPLQAIDTQVREHFNACHTAVITSEHLAALGMSRHSGEALASWAHTQFDDVEVVGFFRSQVLTIPSGWSTAVRSGASIGLARFLAERIKGVNLDFPQLAKGWVDSFDGEQVRLHAYQEDPSWDIRRFFAERYLPGVDDLVFRAPRVNQKLQRPLAEAWRLINKVFPYWIAGSRKPNPHNLQARKVAARALRKVGPPIALSRSQLRLVEQRFGASNREFSERFLPPGESL